MFKIILKIILIILAALICFYAIPFITLLSGANNREIIFREISYRMFYDKLSVGCKDDSAKAINIFKFVKENISAPPLKFQVKDKSPFDVIIESIGSCDQQANVLITLAGIGGIKGNLIFLYGYDSISHHSVCELQINNEYRMFDPFYNQLFLTNNGNLSSINDIQSGNVKFPKDSSLIPNGYFRLFEKKYPLKMNMTNNIPFCKRVVRKFINEWCSIFGGIILKPYVSAYFICDNSNENKKNRIRKLFY
jgi:hypothetical protein